jgi:hypothetical protein
VRIAHDAIEFSGGHAVSRSVFPRLTGEANEITGVSGR